MEALFAEHPWLSIYYWASTVLAFACLCFVPPGRQSMIDSFFGSLIAAVALGWLLWPIAICAALRINLRAVARRIVGLH